MTRPARDPSSLRIEQLYDRLAAPLYRYALMILADPAAASDAVQQVFVALLRRGSAPDSDEGYLRRSVRNECYSMLRKARRANAHLAAALLEPVGVTDDRPEERLAIERAMRQLPAEQREVVHLKVFEELTFQEIADLTDESINTVASRYRYATEKLRGLLTL